MWSTGPLLSVRFASLGTLLLVRHEAAVASTRKMDLVSVVVAACSWTAVGPLIERSSRLCMGSRGPTMAPHFPGSVPPSWKSQIAGRGCVLRVSLRAFSRKPYEPISI